MSVLFAVLFAAFAVSYGWGIRGFIIGGEKGAILPGALMGIAVAFFSGCDRAQEMWMFFAAAGALSMFYGGTETYAQTMSFLLSRDKEGPYYNQLKKGVVGIFLKGGLWFAIPGLVLAMLPSALSGKYEIWEIILIFAFFPFVSVIGTKIFNSPYDKANKKFPRLYFSLDRREEWGSNVLIILVLTVFSLIKGDFFAVGAGLTGFIMGGFGFLIGLVLFDIERRYGNKFFGKLSKNGFIDGWKIMEHAFGAFAGGGLMLYFVLSEKHMTALLENVDLSLLPLGNDKYLFAVIPLVLLLITALQYPVISIVEKKTGKEPDINIFEILERPLFSAVPLIFVFLGAPTAAAFGTFGTVAYVLTEKCSIEKYEHSKYKTWLRLPFKLMWVLLFVWFYIRLGNITLYDCMILYTVAYTGACLMYTYEPDRFIELKKGEKTFRTAFGSGFTVTTHLVIQSIVLLIWAYYSS